MAATAAVVMQSAFATSKLPGFQTKEQLQAHRAKQIAEVERVQASSPTFYTGKINEQDAGKYLFKFRNYDQELLRWTSIDPSGFPDGANGQLYAANPISELDYQGLWRLKVNGQFGYSQDIEPELKMLSGGIGGNASFIYSASISSSTSSATLNFEISGEGRSHIADPVDSILLLATLQVGITSDGKLTLTEGGGSTWKKEKDSVGAGIAYVASGVNTSSMSLNNQFGLGLKATSASAIGISTTGGAVTFTGTSQSEVFTISSYTFEVVE